MNGEAEWHIGFQPKGDGRNFEFICRCEDKMHREMVPLTELLVSRAAIATSNWGKQRMYGERDTVLWAILETRDGLFGRVVGSALLETDADAIIADHAAASALATATEALKEIAEDGVNDIDAQVARAALAKLREQEAAT